MSTWFEDYVLNPEKVEIVVKYSFNLPVVVENFNIDDHPLHIRQNGRTICVNFHQIISKKLYEDIRDFFSSGGPNKVPEILLKRNPSQYIVAYIKETLPKINEEISKRKYNEGHIILNTISLFNIDSVFILGQDKKIYPILWPLAVPTFTTPFELTRSPDVVYIRDLISSMTEYFFYNLDECIRKIITSLENYFHYYSLKPKKGVIYPSTISNSGFLKKVFSYVQQEYYNYPEKDLRILRENIFVIYSIRCKIVHDNLRLGTKNHFFCRKAIVTLTKIYQSKFVRDDKKFEYVFYFYDQFEAILSLVTGINLDELEKASKKSYDPNNIKSPIAGLALSQDMLSL